MSHLTRKRVRWLVAVAVFLVPLNAALAALLLAGGSTTATGWASRMTTEQRTVASGEIEKYPVAYRLELLKVLSPAERAATWKGVVDRYKARHPHLTSSQREAIGGVRQLLTPTLFSGRLASDRERATYNAVTERVVREIGKPDATVLLRTLGPSDTSRAGLPWRVRAAQWLQDKEQTLDAVDCECSTESDWCVSGAECSNAVGCVFQGSWPACGAFYMYACNGMCVPA